jgi:DNA primase
MLLDGDQAGVKALGKMIPQLEAAELKWHAIYLPQGYDPDQFAMKYGGKNLRRGLEAMIEADNRELRINITD